MTKTAELKERFNKQFEYHDGWNPSYTGTELESAILSFLLQELQTQRESDLREVKAMKAKHDIEKDPSGAFSTCLACGKNGAMEGAYCETEWNDHLDAVLSALTPLGME